MIKEENITKCLKDYEENVEKTMMIILNLK